MANKYCNLTGTNKIKDEYTLINDGFELVENDMITGSPAGVYANLTALTAAFPAGNSRIYITVDNGNWNYWNGSAWVAGGLYQSPLTDSPANTIKGNNTGSTAPVMDLEIDDVKAMLDIDDLVVQEFGTSTENAISQKVITDKFDDIDDQLNSVPVTGTAYGLTEAFENAEAGVMQDLLLKGYTSTNLINNGDFSDGTTGWLPKHSGSVITASNNTLIITGNGTTTGVYAYTNTNMNFIQGNEVYIQYYAKVTNDDALRLEVYVKGSASGTLTQVKVVNTPTSGVVNFVSFITTLPSGHTGELLLYINHVYSPAALSNGKVMEVQKVMAIDLTATYGAGNEPDLATCQSRYPNYFDGTVSSDKGEVTVGTGTAITRARYPKLQSVPAITDTFDVLNGLHTQNVQDVAITSGTAINTTNYPLAKNAVGFVIALTAGGTQTGTVGTDSASGNGTLYYQLAEPVLSYYPPKSIPLEINSTIEHNPIISDIAFYSTGFTITDTNYPISALEEVFKVDEETGVETPIAVSTCTVASGGLSFTSTALTNGDLVWIRYSHENGSTIPTTEYTYTTSISGGLATIQQDLKKQNESLQKQIDELRTVIQSLSV